MVATGETVPEPDIPGVLRTVGIARALGVAGGDTAEGTAGAETVAGRGGASRVEDDAAGTGAVSTVTGATSGSRGRRIMTTAWPAITATIAATIATPRALRGRSGSVTARTGGEAVRR